MKKKFLIPIIIASVALTSSAVGVVVAIATGAIRISNGYTVTWKNGEKVLEVDNVQTGDFPHYDGPTPVSDDPTMQFVGWEPEFHTVTNADQVYSAYFKTKVSSYRVSINCMNCTVDGQEEKSEEIFISHLPVTYHFDLPSGDFTHGYPAKRCVSAKTDAGKLYAKGFKYDETTGNLTITELAQNINFTAYGNYSAVELTYKSDGKANTVTLSVDDPSAVELVDWGDVTYATTNTLTHNFKAVASGTTRKIAVYLSNKDNNVPKSFSLANTNGELYSPGNSLITSINYANNLLTTVPDSAFAGCTSLEEINFSRYVTSIGKGVFRGCPSLNKITVDDDNQNYISVDGDGAVIDTKTNTLIYGKSDTVIPGIVETIAPYAFDNSDILTVTIPSSVKKIESYAFNNCKSLTNVTFADSNVWIQDNAFYGCSNVKCFDFSEMKDLPALTIDSFTGSVTNDIFCLPKDSTVREKFLKKIPSEYTMTRNPAAIVLIHRVDEEVACCINGTGIESIDWGDGTTTQYADDNGAYTYTEMLPNMFIRVYNTEGTNITGFTINQTKLYPLGHLATEVKTNEEVTSLDATNYSAASFTTLCFKNIQSFPITKANFPTTVTSLTLPASLERLVPGSDPVESHSFYFGSTGIRSFRIYDNGGAKNYDDYYDNIIYDTRKDNALVFGANPQFIPTDVVKDIPDYVFQCCAFSDTIKIPEGVETIGDEAFMNCFNLEKLYLPKSVRSVGLWLTSHARNLTEIKVDDDNPYYYSYENNLLIESATKNLKLGTVDCTTVPEDIKIVSDFALADATQLKSVNLPEITYIGDYAFHSCTQLTDIALSNKIEYLGVYSFSYCTSVQCVDMRAITQESEIPTHGSGMFNKCTQTIYYRVSSIEIRIAFMKKGGWPNDTSYYLIGDEPIPSSIQ